jgi:HlyD family secretion protein
MNLLQAPGVATLVRGRRRWVVLGAVVVVSALVLLSRRSQPVRYLTATMQHGDLRDEVDATGTVNAVITVQVGSQVSGTIAKLHADFNSRVHKGEIIAEIEPSLFQGALLQATADLESARASVTAAQANLEKAKAVEVQTKAEYDRAAALVKNGMETHQVLETDQANYDAAVASVHAAEASIEQANALVSQKTAAVSVARTNLGHTVIRSPIDGIVVARNVDVGQTVAASLQAPTIFTIAQDLTKMQVYTNVDESDVGRIQVGRPVTFTVDAFPSDTFRGVVSQMRMNATTIQNVVTYDAIIDFANPDLKLFPGMTAYVTIPVATVTNVLKLPNAALRFRPPIPPEQLRAMYAKYGIDPDAPAGGQLLVEQPAGTARARADDTSSQSGSGPAPPERRRPAPTSVVWRLRAGGTIEPVLISLGITDHTYTEVSALLHGQLEPGDQVVIGSMVQGESGPGGPSLRR